MTVRPLFTDAELLAKVAMADERAFRKLYDTFGDKVYTQAFRLLHSKEKAEELMQEVFLKIWRMGPALREIESLDAYLGKMTRNRTLNVLRDQARAKGWIQEVVAEDDIAGRNDTEEALLLKEAKNALKEAIAMLPEQQREVYLLCHEEGLKYDEAAQRLNIAPLTVKTHMQRALKFLRKHLKDYNDFAAIVILLKLF